MVSYIVLEIMWFLNTKKKTKAKSLQSFLVILTKRKMFIDMYWL